MSFFLHYRCQEANPPSPPLHQSPPPRKQPTYTFICTVQEVVETACLRFITVARGILCKISCTVPIWPGRRPLSSLYNWIARNLRYCPDSPWGAFRLLISGFLQDVVCEVHSYTHTEQLQERGEGDTLTTLMIKKATSSCGETPIGGNWTQQLSATFSTVLYLLFLKFFFKYAFMKHWCIFWPLWLNTYAF